MSEKLRFGIVGCGGIAKKFARDIKITKTAELVAIASRSKAKAMEYKKMYEVDFAYSSYEELAKSDVIDAVYIATPHNFHYSLALLFMENKKHVLIEKPIAINQKQYLKMMECAKKNNVLMMEAMWTSFLPVTRYLLDYIKNNDIGKLKSAKIELGYSLAENQSSDSRLLRLDLAGGSLLDLGIYPINFYNLISQVPIKSIKAKASFTDTNIDEKTIVEIANMDNATILIRSSISENFSNNALLNFENSNIKVIDFSRSNKLIIDQKVIMLDYEGEGFVHEIRSFVESVHNKEKENPIMNFKLTSKNIEIMDKVRDLIKLKYPFE